MTSYLLFANDSDGIAAALAAGANDPEIFEAWTAGLAPGEYADHLDAGLDHATIISSVRTEWDAAKASMPGIFEVDWMTARRQGMPSSMIVELAAGLKANGRLDDLVQAVGLWLAGVQIDQIIELTKKRGQIHDFVVRAVHARCANDPDYEPMTALDEIVELFDQRVDLDAYAAAVMRADVATTTEVMAAGISLRHYVDIWNVLADRDGASHQQVLEVVRLVDEETFMATRRQLGDDRELMARFLDDRRAGYDHDAALLVTIQHRAPDVLRARILDANAAAMRSDQDRLSVTWRGVEQPSTTEDEGRGRGRPAIGPRIEVRLDDPLLQAIDRGAAVNGITRSEEIRRRLLVSYGS